MIKFTIEEISLCKQVAERYKKKRLELGDWYLLKLLHDKEQVRLYGNQKPWIILTKDFIPLWTISDCLEFLGEKFERLRFCDDKKFEVQIWLPDGFYYHIGNTPLEAYLKAVLGVLNA